MRSLKRLDDYEPTAIETQEAMKTAIEVIGLERGRGHAFKCEDGRYRRLDMLDRLWSAKKITTAQYQGGKRYQRQYSAFCEINRCPSSLEARTESDNAGQILRMGIEIGRVRREALGNDRGAIGVIDRVCGENEPIAERWFPALCIALERLAHHYAEPIELEDVAALAPRLRSLRDRADKIIENFAGLHTRDTGRGMRLREVHAALDLAPLLWEIQGGQCCVCAAQMPRNQGSYEHVQPKYRGGADAPGNLLLSHIKCNNKKDHEPPNAFTIAMLRRVNTILGWEDEEPDEDAERAEQLMNALERLKQVEATATAPSVKRRAPSGKSRVLVQAEKEWAELLPEKPSRDDHSMDQKWLAEQGVLRANRDYRHMGVQARATNRKVAKAKGRKALPRHRQRG